MRGLCLCSFIVLRYHAAESSESVCDASRNLTGVVGGEVTLYVGHTDISSISWVRVKDLKALAETKPGSVINDVMRSDRGRLKATQNGSLVITHLTREDQGSYKARVRRSSHCTQMYHLTVCDKRYNNSLNDPESSHNSSSELLDKRYNNSLNDPESSHNSSSELLGWPQHLLTKVVPPVIIVLVVVTAILIFGYRQKRHPQHICMSGSTPRKADNEKGSVWKINDIYSIESSSHRIEDSSVQ